MKVQDLRSMLDRMPGIRHACDVDLLVFFYRHPRALLAREQLTAYLGYEREQAVKSLERLIKAGFVTRSQNPSRAARLHVLQLDALPDGLLPRFLEIAAMRQGRQDVIDLLKSEPDGAPAARHRRRASITKGA